MSAEDLMVCFICCSVVTAFYTSALVWQILRRYHAGLFDWVAGLTGPCGLVLAIIFYQEPSLPTFTPPTLQQGACLLLVLLAVAFVIGTRWIPSKAREWPLSSKTDPLTRALRRSRG